MKKLRTIFMGTPQFAIPSLYALAEHFELLLVITQPDRRKGRGKKVIFSPVKQKAMDLGIEVMQPEIVKGRRFAEKIAKYNPDVIVTAAYGRILGESLLKTAQYGCINVHASILPKYRGSAPVNRAILNGDKEAGVSIMETVKELDAGAVFKIVTTRIGPNETAGELTDRLAVLGAGALIDVLDNIDSIVSFKQDESLVTYAPQLKKSDGHINWADDAVIIERHVRGVHPWPSAFTMWNNKPLKVHASIVLSKECLSDIRHGTVIDHTKNGLDVACRKGVLRIIKMQLPGKKILDSKSFFAGVKIASGTVLL